MAHCGTKGDAYRDADSDVVQCCTKGSTNTDTNCNS
jgi:hypothetical protein